MEALARCIRIDLRIRIAMEESKRGMGSWVRVGLLSVLLTLMHTFVAPGNAASQSRARATLEVEVCDRATGRALPAALVIAQLDSAKVGNITNAEGIATFGRLPVGVYTVTVKYLGYESERVSVVLESDQRVAVGLREGTIAVRSVVVTAREGRTPTSTSTIGKEALQHLQPSSMADVMELLPGGFSKDPNLTQAQMFVIREAAIPPANLPREWAKVSQKNYTTTALGTQVMVDGVPINTHAGMQRLAGLWRPQQYKHVFLNRGVDARSLGTDNIDHIEIIRGIPGAEYSNLTSGLIKIHRKAAYSDLEARLKTDMKSTLFYVGKGFELQQRTLGVVVSADYLNAYADPRNVRERFQRLNGSVRINKRWDRPRGTVRLNASVDYAGTFDNSKDDPDINLGNRDIFISERQHLQLSQGVEVRFNDNALKLHELECIVSADGQREIMRIDRYVSTGLTTPILSATESGEGYVGFYPPNYIANQTVEGLPLYGYAKIHLEHRFYAPAALAHEVRYGGNARYAKNYGRGDIFDPAFPVFPGNGTRAYPFRGVPGESVFSLFAEDNLRLTVGNFNAELSAGVSGNTLAFLPSEYKMHRRWYFDPRINAQIGYVFLNTPGTEPLSVELSGGVGWLSMFPTINQLFPENEYLDMVELNYWHAKKEYRTAYVRTYVQPIDGTQLSPARNFKWEVRLGGDWNGYSLSITYFEEELRNGFRMGNHFTPLRYRNYISSDIAHGSLTAPPRVEDLRYELQYRAYMRPVSSNGSRTYKTGVEWVVSTRRFPVSRIRLTFDGAWFRTQYNNSLPLFAVPAIGFMGKRYPYVGYYEDIEGVEQESLNTTLRADAHIPQLDLTLSVAIQNNWYGKSRYLPRNEWPAKYVDYEGNWKEFHAADRQDRVLQFLQRPVDNLETRIFYVPMMANVNLKATKWLFNHKLQVALFVNKIFDYTPDYKQDGATIRRYQDPYFGMEANLKL